MGRKKGTSKTGKGSKARCPGCGNTYIKTKTEQTYCSQPCYQKKGPKRITKPSEVELALKLRSKPVTTIAREYGVSDNAVRKWAKGYGLEVPKRGFWQRFFGKKS